MQQEYFFKQYPIMKYLTLVACLLPFLFMYPSFAQNKTGDSTRLIKNYIGFGYFRANPKAVDRLGKAGVFLDIGILGDLKSIVPQLDIKFGSGINLFDVRYSQTQFSLLIGKKVKVMTKRFIMLPSFGISYYIQNKRDDETDFHTVTTNGVSLPLSLKLYKAKEKLHLAGSFMANINSETVFYSTGLEFTF